MGNAKRAIAVAATAGGLLMATAGVAAADADGYGAAVRSPGGKTAPLTPSRTSSYAAPTTDELTIAMLPASRLDPRVVEAAQRGSGSAEQLVRNLLALVTSDSPVLPRSQRSETRPGDQLLASAPANQPDRATNRPSHTNMPRQDVQSNADRRTAMLHDAMDMLTGMHDIDLTAVAGRNTQNLVDHLQDEM